MKKIILILGTIILAVWIVSNLFLSESGLQGNAQSVQNRTNQEINKIAPK